MFKALIKGTFILTVTGLITRVIGFVYKIYLSNILGAGMLGVYQLVFPIFSICFTIFGAGIQTAISQMVASAKEDFEAIRKILIRSLVISVSLAIGLSVGTFLLSDFLALRILGEVQCAIPLKVLTLAFPVCAAAACINGCYYGIKEAGVPAVSQLFEQIARVAFVYIAAMFIAGDNVMFMCILAVAGIAVGEGISMLYNIISVAVFFKKKAKSAAEYDCITDKEDKKKSCNRLKYRLKKDNRKLTNTLLRLSVPLTGNRLVVALLHSVETILIPIMLKKYGMSPVDALSVYGVLTGMAIPLIMFPSTITNSLSVLLLPTISEVSDNGRHVKRISNICILCSLALGIASTILFVAFGANLGTKVFNNESVGLFVEILAFLCPFLFTATTIASIINGLGYTHYTFVITIIGLAIRIFMTVKLVPAQGISGYLISLLVSQLAVTLLSYGVYRRLVHSIFPAKANEALSGTR